MAAREPDLSGEALIARLQDAALYPHPVDGFTILQTHISWLLLTGAYVYKIKKPLDLGFLDFSTLDKRRHYCYEELRLNRRTAPAIYLDVVCVTGSARSLSLDGSGMPIEYAVKMRQFPQQARLDRVLERGELLPEHMDDLAQRLVEFHAAAASAGERSSFGTPQRVYHPVVENFTQMRESISDPTNRRRLERLQAWSKTAHTRLETRLVQRHAAARVRECHGDLHLANLALLDGRVVPFDCLEFNEHLRWIDVMSELAFLIMDLDDRRQSSLGHRVLNAYLQGSGDYAGLEVLRYYLVYRALVRAKVACIRLNQPDLPSAERQAAVTEYRAYLALAELYTQPRPTAIIITRGCSGAGKTSTTAELLEPLGLVRLRSDVERKRLYGLGAMARSGAAPGAGIYTPQAGVRTYARLTELAEIGVRSGYPMLVDATFLARAQRAPFRELAERRGVPFLLLDFQVPDALLQQRVRARHIAGTDASEANLQVLARQLESYQPLDPEERKTALTVDLELADDSARLAANIAERAGLTVPGARAPASA